MVVVNVISGILPGTSFRRDPTPPHHPRQRCRKVYLHCLTHNLVNIKGLLMLRPLNAA